MIGYLRETLYRLRGRNRYAHFRENAALCSLPTEELRRRQFWLLSSMLRHAHANVPYYRARFDDLRITPEDIRSFDDFSAFPVLTRQDIEDNLSSLLSVSVLENMRYLNFSGGTTGQPVRFYQDRRLRETMEANWLLCLSFAGWKPSDMVVNVWGNPRDINSTLIGHGLQPWLAGQLNLNAYRYGRGELKGWTEAIRRYRRVFLYGYVSAIADLAEYVEENNEKNLSVRGVITTAEVLDPGRRELISRAFNCKVHNQYGSREVPGVASECSHGGMHLLTHSAYAEFLPLPDGRDNGGAGENSRTGRLVLTGLTNRAMPLIRYEIGDTGAPVDGMCPCGRGFPLMSMELGRLGSTLRTLDGKRLYSTYFVRQMYGMDGVNIFQFRQTALDTVRLYVVPGKNFSQHTKDKLRALQENFSGNICPGMRLELDYVNEVPKTAGGKHRQVVCDISDEIGGQ